MISSVDSSSVVKLKTPALLTTTSRRPASPPRSRTAVRALIASVTSPRRQWIWGCRARAASSASLRRARPEDGRARHEDDPALISRCHPSLPRAHLQEATPSSIAGRTSVALCSAARVRGRRLRHILRLEARAPVSGGLRDIAEQIVEPLGHRRMREDGVAQG
jgi:hypothetical protein